MNAMDDRTVFHMWSTLCKHRNANARLPRSGAAGTDLLLIRANPVAMKEQEKKEQKQQEQKKELKNEQKQQEKKDQQK